MKIRFYAESARIEPKLNLFFRSKFTQLFCRTSKDIFNILIQHAIFSVLIVNECR